MTKRFRLPRASTIALWVCATVAAPLGAGCAMGVERFGVPIAGDLASRIEPGRTTRGEVLALLGPPTRQSLLANDLDGPAARPASGEEVLLWQYQERHERFGTALFYTYFSQRTLTDSLMVVLDERGVVAHVAFGQQTRGQ